jgi:hypothetical protein
MKADKQHIFALLNKECLFSVGFDIRFCMLILGKLIKILANASHFYNFVAKFTFLPGRSCQKIQLTMPPLSLSLPSSHMLFLPAGDVPVAEKTREKDIAT